jgi:hypothetical protein
MKLQKSSNQADIFQERQSTEAIPEEKAVYYEQSVVEYFDTLLSFHLAALTTTWIVLLLRLVS